ncbi:DUF1793-domain-containing protein [Saccharata proteae CBS 121410]|uniref:DUF1793-domain-containing protein n=1 Tax=Saccharata proteae CBS 121410 TaxID=1314787 RepID=A0A9P4LT55_9PEZI|nr:DUF1793-domain-containing protein [Saccharata proteae CBS 121410]
MANIHHLIRLALAFFFAAKSTAASFTPILPPSYPLAVKNPYLSAWLPGNQAADLPSAQPEFWYANSLTWSVIARVDGTVYNLFGVPSPADNTQSATVVSGNFSSTHSIFLLTAGNAEVTLDFFSPVSVDDYQRQSLPFSYLTVTVSPLNDATPSVQIYSHIDDTWTGQSTSSTINITTTGETSVYQVTANDQATYSELEQMAAWGTAVYAARGSDQHNLTYQSGPSATVTEQFINDGYLTDVAEDWAAGNVAGFSQDLGTVSMPLDFHFVVGYVRIETINYRGSARTHYYRADYPDTVDATSHFFDIYDDAKSESVTFDSQVISVGEAAGGTNYSAILEISVRQIFGGIDITIPGDTLDTSEVWGFIKEISSNGNLNTVDIITPTFPFFYSWNADYIKILLEPMLTYLATDTKQKKGAYPNAYTIHDMGSNYPNSTGHDDGNDEAMPLEETGNLLILIAAYQAATGDTSLATTYASLLRGYADYLVDNGEYPVYQLSTNDGLGAFTNMTNLAVKAAVGLAAYGQFSSLANYTAVGKDFADAIYGTNNSGDGLGTDIDSSTNEPYFTLQYNSTTWFMTFNLYPDKLLNLSIFPDEAYTGMSSLYQSVHCVSGVPIEGAVNWAKTDWQMWVASIADESTKELLIDDLWGFVSNGENTAPFGDRYWACGDDAGQVAAGFRARPTLGGHFASVALEQGVL